MTNEPVGPGLPADDATEPVNTPGPADTPTEPVDTPSQSVETAAGPVDTPTEPIEAVAEPVDTPTEPVETAAQPDDTGTEPKEAVAEPVDTPTEPIEAVAEPVDPTEPIDTPIPPPPPPPFGFVPPAAGFRPPGGFPPPPPGTGGWATRYGLVRPAQGRMLAGVCAAIGRATNTDPVLWRVLFAVLTIAGGVGLLAYVIGWLLIPSEGDTGSPVEALLGRGRSSTSPVLVIIVGVIAAIGLGSAVYSGLRSAVVLLVVILGAVFLIGRGGGPGTSPVPPADPNLATGTGPEDRLTPPSPPPTWAAAPPGTAGTAMGGPGYRAPFAPHGPYAASRYPYPGLAYPTPPVAPPVAPPVPARRSRSRLGRFTLSLGLLVVGILAIVRIAGVHVPFSVYAASVLGVIGLGLVIGAWFGRARGLIPLGVILSLLAALGAGVSGRVPDMAHGNGDLSLTPATVAGIEDDYHHNFGDFTLDLRNVDFTGADKHVTITQNAGDLTILLPPNVNATVHAKLNAGDATVLGSKWGGIGMARRDIVDNGADGPGGGTLTLDITQNLGDLEVHR